MHISGYLQTGGAVTVNRRARAAYVDSTASYLTDPDSCSPDIDAKRRAALHYIAVGTGLSIYRE